MTKTASTPAAPRERPGRDRDATKARILAAVGVVLARDGFGGLGVNAIAKEAAVDKVLIYRYFGGLEDLLAEWGASGRFWPQAADLLGDDPEGFLALPLAERYARFFEHFIDALRARPLTLEILAAEVVERNALTAILESEREHWGEEASRLLGGTAFAGRAEMRGLTLLLISGVQYLLVRSRKIRIFGGVDIQQDAGWAELKASIRHTAAVLLAPASQASSPPAKPRAASKPKRRLV
ncbi:MAG TPA: helix-turn-helix domain-containing protein [Caldimonas sp.]|nr:helix-turn-helix domain-containing protein [Caldimonas sp.]HEX2543125.1 helix-turn-helix domain-containing protein [Caldimonas sp.]